MKTKLNESTHFSDVLNASWGRACIYDSPDHTSTTEVLISNIGNEIVFVNACNPPCGYYRINLKCTCVDMNGVYLEDLKNWLKGQYTFRRLVKSFEIY